MNPIAALLFFITIVNLFLAVLVYFRNHKNSLHISLSRFIFLVAAWTLCMGGFYQAQNTADVFWWIRLTYIFGIVIANTLVYFALVFPKGSQIPLIQKFLVYTPALPWIAAILFIPNFLFKEIVSFDWWKDVRLGVLEYTIYTIYFITVYFGAIAILFKKYFTYTGKLKTQVTYVLYAVFIAGTFGAIFDLLYPWLNLYKYIWLGPIGTLIMVGIFAYAIVKHRFLDIRLILARTVTYSLLSLILGAIYAIGLFGIGSLLTGLSSSVPQLINSTILALIMAFSFQPLRRFLESTTDQIFFKGRYSSEHLLSKLSSIMSATIDLPVVTSQILQTLVTEMRISKGAFILLEADKIYDVLQIGFTGKSVFEMQISLLSNAPDDLIVFDELEEGELKDWMRNWGVSVSRVLKVNEEKVGLLILGDKASGETYSSEDLRLISILAPEVAVAIQNAKSYDKIKKFNVTLSQEVDKATADLIKTSKQLESANLKLMELDRLKDDFVSVASHELRTPMTAIRSYAWMALHRSDVPLSEKLKKYLTRTLISTERLINLVNDMLNISRIESGKVEVVPAPFSIQRLASDVLNEVLEKAQEKNLHLHLLSSQMPEVFADGDKVHQILLNLIGNAIKFTPQGGEITVSFFCDGSTVETSIKDNGLGIAKEDLPRLFKKFNRLDNSYVGTATAAGGTGLGLYICKELVNLMGGQIWVKSEGLGKGSVFTFSLPIATKENLAHGGDFASLVDGTPKMLEPVTI